MARNPLDGPGMGYGPGAGNDGRGSSMVTAILALVCLLLAVTLAYVLLRPAPQTAAPVVTVTATVAPPTPKPAAKKPASAKPSATRSASRSATPPATATPSGSDATQRAEAPAGVIETATAFVTAWLEPRSEVRVPKLQECATESLTALLTDVDPAKIPKAKPTGAPVVSSASDYAAVADQKLSDGSRVRMELVYDPGARYGWLVDTIEPLE